MLAGHWRSHWGEWDLFITILAVSCVAIGYLVRRLIDDEVA
jgi:hypothetical protein